MEQAKFIETIELIKKKAVEQEKKISLAQIHEELERADLQLDEAQLKMVYAFLKTTQIEIVDDDDEDVILDEDTVKYFTNASQENEEEPSAVVEEGNMSQNGDVVKASDEDKDLTDHEKEILQMYQDEVAGVPVMNDEQILECMKIMASSDSTKGQQDECRGKLVNTFLKDVIRWVANYKDGAVVMNDLIQEGNMAMMELIAGYDYAVALESTNPLRKLKDSVKKAVVGSAQGLIFEQESANNVGFKVAGRVNAVNECAKSIYEDFGRKATIAEVAEMMEMPEEEVREIVELSANKIEFIE